MTSKRDRTKQPFDVDAFQREAEATLAGMTDAEVEAMHRRADAKITRRDGEIADAIARKFFEGLKDGRNLPRPARARRRAPTP